MKKFRGIIFDLDGVICSTDELHYESWQEISDKYKLHFDSIINNKLRGIGRAESFKVIVKENKLKIKQFDIGSIISEKNEIYKKKLMEFGTQDLDDEVAKTLAKIKNEGYLMAIGSSSKNAKFILERLGIIDMFDFISDGTNNENSKPHPEVFWNAARGLGLLPNECIVVEDADVGVEAALSGGFSCAGISAASKNNRTTYQLKTFKELLKYI